tara:strand:+ start:107 stop:433 length:327 start_codon:yes stop_codon:yes gene_type:complete
MSEFISEEVFQKEVAERANVIPWSEVAINRIYQIEEILPRKSDFGEQFILRLTTEDGTSCRAWASSLLREEIKTLPRDKKMFVRPLGQCQTKKNPDKKFHKYELITLE